jgi:hypothetical protein
MESGRFWNLSALKIEQLEHYKKEASRVPISAIFESLIINMERSCMARISNERMDEFKEIAKKKSIDFKSDGEARESAENLVGLFEVLIKIDREEQARKARLKDEPKGFQMQGGGRTCGLCHSSYDQPMWYDKYGMKCLACQEAIDRKIVPVSVLKDKDTKEHILGSALASKMDIRVVTLKKMVRLGKITARIIPKSGEMVFLRKENPEFATVIEQEVSAITKKKAERENA